MREHAIDAVWPAADRIAVLVDGHPDAGAAIRAAWRLASGLRTELVALALVPPDGLEAMPTDGRQALKRNLDLAEDLGAAIRLLPADDPVEALAAVAREENVTTLVLGHAPHAGWRSRFRTPLADRLLHRLDNVAIHLVEIG
jgi:two-component system sensor histidine kinase KdpD